MSVKDDIWAFALANADYWQLLRSSEEPPEVAVLNDDDKAAFNAARREVQRRLVELVRACWTELNTRCSGGPMKDWFSQNSQAGKILANESSVPLKNSKGWLSITLEEGQDKKLKLRATLEVAKKRASDARAVWAGALGDGAAMYFESAIAREQDDKANATAFTDVYFNQLATWVAQAANIAKEGPESES